MPPTPPLLPLLLSPTSIPASPAPPQPPFVSLLFISAKLNSFIYFTLCFCQVFFLLSSGKTIRQPPASSANHLFQLRREIIKARFRSYSTLLSLSFSFPYPFSFEIILNRNFARSPVYFLPAIFFC